MIYEYDINFLNIQSYFLSHRYTCKKNILVLMNDYDIYDNDNYDNHNDNDNDNTELIRNEKNRLMIGNMVRNDKWNDILKIISDDKQQLIDLNAGLFNGNNLFHMACIKGETEFIKKLLKLKAENKINLNINVFNYDGESGAHLYYKYGGTDPFLLSDKELCYVDTNNFVLARYLIGKIDLLETLIDKMIDNGCIGNVGIRNDNYMFNLLIAKEVHYSRIDKNVADKYLKIIKKLYREIKPSDLVFIAINKNCIDVIKMLMMMNYNFDVYNSYNVSAISQCVRYNRVEILVLILEYTKKYSGIHNVFKLINSSDMLYDARPIFIAIDTHNTAILNILIQYMEQYVDYTESGSPNNKIMLDYTDSAHNTYLHWLLTSDTLNDISDEVIKFLIDHTNVNRENYAGVTPAHLLFGKGVWKRFKSSLIGREIDLLKVDDLNNNCYSYINADDKAEFLELTKQIILPLNITNTKDVNNFFNIKTLQNLLTPSHDKSNESIKTNIDNIGQASIEKIKSKNYGLFNANLIHYMLYLKYLMNKHKSMYVPFQEYDEEIMKRDVFFFNMVSSYETSQDQGALITHVRLYQLMFYSFMPHDVCWFDGDCYYYHPDLIYILSNHNENVSIDEQRYIMLKITVIVAKNTLHANALIYDRLNKEAWRFEPYGVTRLTNRGSIDQKLYEILSDVYGKIKYYDPDSYLSDLNFQMVDGEDFTVTKNFGDPGGYCLAWCIWFIDVVISHPDKNVRYIMKNFFSRNDVSEILSDEEGYKIESKNYYLDFIRKYAHKLDSEKNAILTNLGIQEYYMYNTIFTDIVRNKIMDMFKIGSNIPVDMLKNLVHKNDTSQNQNK